MLGDPPPLDASWDALLAAEAPGDPATVARAVRAQSRFYNGVESAPPPDVQRVARTRFWFPRDVPKPWRPWRELAVRNRLPSRPLRVLDLGAGLGASAVGVLLADVEQRIAHVDLVDQDARALASAERILATARAHAALQHPARLRTVTGSFAAPDALHARLTPPYDVILAVDAFVEAARDDDPRLSGSTLAALLSPFLGPAWLAPDGVLLVLEPALRRDARALHHGRARLADRARILGPCTHSAACPMLVRDRDWCHEDHATALATPFARIAQDAGLHWEGLTYAWLALGPGVAETATPAVPATFVEARLVSAPRRLKGRTEALACGAFGTATGLRWMQLRRHGDEGGRSLEDSTRGDTLLVPRAQVCEAPEGATVRVHGLTPAIDD